MTPTQQLFNSLRNTEPKFDYHSDMQVSQFLSLNREIFVHAINVCELWQSDIDLTVVAEKLLKHLPNKPYGSYNPKPEKEPDPFWKPYEYWGSKRDKKGLPE